MQKLFFPSSKPRFVDDKKIIKMLKGLASKVARRNKNVESIYLFGSYAQGNAGIHSDADILIILQQDTRNMLERLDEFIMAFSAGPVPVDVLVYTRAELDKAHKEGNRFLDRAVSGLRLA